MVAELIVEKFKKHEREVGMRIGREEGWAGGRQEGLQEGQQVGREEERQEWRAWYERQQAALRAGQPFTEPPPGHSANGSGEKSP